MFLVNPRLTGWEDAFSGTEHGTMSLEEKGVDSAELISESGLRAAKDEWDKLYLPISGL